MAESQKHHARQRIHKNIQWFHSGFHKESKSVCSNNTGNKSSDRSQMTVSEKGRRYKELLGHRHEVLFEVIKLFSM